MLEAKKKERVEALEELNRLGNEFGFTAGMLDIDSVYGSAAYDRSLFHLPIGQGCQWEEIKYLKERGVSKQYLGTAAGDNLDQKISNIEVFKRGFTSAVLPVHVFKKVLAQ